MRTTKTRAYQLTPKGLKRLQGELSKAKEELRDLYREKQEVVSNGGNFMENPYFLDCKVQIEALQFKISQLKGKIRQAEVIEDVCPKNGRIEIGSIILVELKEEGREPRQEKFNVITITDPESTDPYNGVISYDAPLAKAILGSRQGDVRNYSVLNKNFTVEVILIF